MNQASLFTGEGGFDLAAEWMGWDNIFHCELNDNLRWFLRNRWPKAKSYADIKQTDFTIWRGIIDVLTGGFPCQPYSQSGKRKGKEDDRHLWPEMLRAIREAQPTWVVGENVRGLINWNGGLVFEEVQADLEAEGYEVQPFLLPAAGVGAPHERYRIWFVAYDTSSNRRKGERQESSEKNREQGFRQDRELEGGSERFCSFRNVTNTNSKRRCERRMHQNESEKTEGHFSSCDSWRVRNTWKNFPTQPPICTGDDGFSTESLRQLIREDSNGYLSEKEIDKIFSKANIKWRKEVLMAGGNAVVPQIPLQIFKAIEQYEKM